MKKRFTAVITILIVILNLLANCSYADELTSGGTFYNQNSSETALSVMQSTNQNNMDSAFENGTVSTGDGQNGNKEQSGVSITPTSSSNAPVTALLSTLILILSKLIINPIIGSIVGDDSNYFSRSFYVGKALSNKYDLVNIKYFITKPDSNTNKEAKSVLKILNESVPAWYMSIRNIALAGCVVTLIYVGIRMALATVASERAKYQKMAISWVEGMILMFVLQYIFIGAIWASDWLVNLINKIANNGGHNIWDVETKISANIFNATMNTGTMGRIIYITLWVILLGTQIKFCVIYVIRMFKIGFYMIIAPLVCMTYSIDKLGDGRAQGFDNWLRATLMTIFLQPMHLFVYTIFIYSFGAIALKFPLLGIMFLLALGKMEKLLQRMLGLRPAGMKQLDDIKLRGGLKKMIPRRR